MNDIDDSIYMDTIEDKEVADAELAKLMTEVTSKKKDGELENGHYRAVSFVAGDFKVTVKYELVNLVTKMVLISYSSDAAKERYVLNVRHIEVVRITDIYGTPNRGFVIDEDFKDIVMRDSKVNVIDFKVIKKAKKVYKQIILKG